MVVGFTERLQKVLQTVEGSRAIAVIGRDGIAVERLTVYEEPNLDLATAQFTDIAKKLQMANQELEAFGKKAQSALDEGKLQIELLRMQRRQDNAARDLGLLIHRRERGGEAEPRRIDALLLRLDDLERDVARLERQISETRRQRGQGSPGAPPVATTGATQASE